MTASPPAAEYLIALACGHSTRRDSPILAGSWVSCWAIMHPARGCQTQRKVISVTRTESEAAR